MFSKKEEPTAEEVLEKFGLNIANKTKEEIATINAADLRRISHKMRGNKFLLAGINLSMGNAVEKAQLSYLAALVDQNWILIRQNEIIIKSLDK